MSNSGSSSFVVLLCGKLSFIARRSARQGQQGGRVGGAWAYGGE